MLKLIIIFIPALQQQHFGYDRKGGDAGHAVQYEYLVPARVDH
jgi:hypothetical protein